MYTKKEIYLGASMYIKVIGFMLSIAFVSITWYGYLLYPSIPALIFAVLTTLSMVFIIIKYFMRDKHSDLARSKEKPFDMIRIILFSITFLTFLCFVALSMTFGGSAVSDDYASEFNENYEVGSFYVSDHGNFVEVSEDIWKLLDITEKVIFPLFILTFVWSFVVIIKNNRAKSTLSNDFDS